MAVERLDCDQSSERMTHVLTLAKRIEVRARTVVIASGARYRRPDVATLEDFEGNGVSSWASPIEAQACAGEEVALVGGGNSAGQAVVFLAPSVKRLHLVARRDLAETMSAYLVERIASLSNIELHVGCELAGLQREPSGMVSATFRDKNDRAYVEHGLRQVFLFIGADPNTAWLGGSIDVDEQGSWPPANNSAQTSTWGERHLSLRQVGRVSSRSATSAPDPRSAWQPRLAKELRSSLRSTRR